jgi:serine protease inhibitor
MEADFSGMTGGKDLFISKVLHNSFIEVNEKGAKAAAATAVIMAEKIMVGKPPVYFRADHPSFLLYVISEWHHIVRRPIGPTRLKQLHDNGTGYHHRTK